MYRVTLSDAKGWVWSNVFSGWQTAIRFASNFYRFPDLFIDVTPEGGGPPTIDMICTIVYHGITK